VNKDQITPTRRPRRARRWQIIAVVLIGIGFAILMAAEFALHHAGPVLRGRVIDALSTRFNSQVELGEFNVEIDKGINVEGKNLSLRSNLYPDLPPQISVRQFDFHAGLLDIFRRPMHIHLIELQGLDIKIPPKDKRAAMPKLKKGHAKIKIILDRIVCNDALLAILNGDPSKTPLQFKIHALTLRRVGTNKPMHFDAELVNPKPLGNIASHGDFGPWNAERPHATPINGNYSFTNADLSTTKGIAGTLSSTGKFSGPLDTITVDGETDTPNFSVDVSGHQVALHTVFHAIVDGTNGNTDLQPVHAHFLNTYITATGTVNRAPAGIKGHDINLDILIDKGRVEDLLQIGAKTLPPVMSGAIHLKTKFHLPPGKESVSRKLQLRGAFAIDNALFSNPHIQKKVDELSMRAQGHSDEARELAQEQPSDAVQLPHAAASMHGNFSLVNRKLALPQLVCTVPGAHIALTGTYTLDGKQFDFTGRAQMQAHVSSLVGGWKGRLLAPLDPFFAHGEAGTDVPIKITGTKSKPHFGLNF
jgi:hypothetical protein